MEDRTSKAALFLLLLMFAALIGLGGLLFWQGYKDALARAEASATTAASAVAAHAQWLVEASGQTLERIDAAIRTDAPALDVPSPADIDDVVADLPSGFHVRVFDAVGNQLFTDTPEDGAFNVASRDYFQMISGGRETYLSSFTVDPLTGNAGFFVAERLERRGEFAGVAVVLVPNDLLSDFWETLELGRGSSAGILREDGLLMARHPPPAEGLDLGDHVLFTDHLPANAWGFYHSASSPADGISRIVAYQKVEGSPMVAIAAVSRGTALAPYWQRVTRIVSVGLPIIAILLLLAFWVARLLRLDARTRQTLKETGEQNQLLLREVHHRVKNNLQMVASLVQLQPLPEDAKRELRSRIIAMAAVHEHLHQQDARGVNLARYLEGILRGVNETYGGVIGLDLRLDPVQVDADTATSLGLLANELITNTNKYAFPEGPAGTFGSVLVEDDQGTASLSFFNDGVPFDSTAKTNGIGIRLVRSLAAKVNDDYVFEGKSGLDFRISFPASV